MKYRFFLFNLVWISIAFNYNYAAELPQEPIPASPQIEPMSSQTEGTATPESMTPAPSFSSEPEPVPQQEAPAQVTPALQQTPMDPPPGILRPETTPAPSTQTTMRQTESTVIVSEQDVQSMKATTSQVKTWLKQAQDINKKITLNITQINAERSSLDEQKYTLDKEISDFIQKTTQALGALNVSAVTGPEQETIKQIEQELNSIQQIRDSLVQKEKDLGDLVNKMLEDASQAEAAEQNIVSGDATQAQHNLDAINEALKRVSQAHDSLVKDLTPAFQNIIQSAHTKITSTQAHLDSLHASHQTPPTLPSVQNAPPATTLNVTVPVVTPSPAVPTTSPSTVPTLPPAEQPAVATAAPSKTEESKQPEKTTEKESVKPIHIGTTQTIVDHLKIIAIHIGSLISKVLHAIGHFIFHVFEQPDPDSQQNKSISSFTKGLFWKTIHTIKSGFVCVWDKLSGLFTSTKPTQIPAVSTKKVIEEPPITVEHKTEVVVTPPTLEHKTDVVVTPSAS